MKRIHEYDAEWQPIRDFIGTCRTMNDKFVSYIKSMNMMKEKLQNETSVVVLDNTRRTAIV